MAEYFNPSWVKGKKIVSVELHPFPDGRGGIAHDPVFILENGGEIQFSVEETETGEYGVLPVYRTKKAAAR